MRILVSNYFKSIMYFVDCQMLLYIVKPSSQLSFEPFPCLNINADTLPNAFTDHSLNSHSKVVSENETSWKTFSAFRLFCLSPKLASKSCSSGPKSVHGFLIGSEGQGSGGDRCGRSPEGKPNDYSK